VHVCKPRSGVFLVQWSSFGRMPYLTLPMTHITAGIETQVHMVKVQQLNQRATAAA